jgi:urocanate hydratase
MLLDGSIEAERRLRSMLFFDVNNGIARRAWAGNKHAIFSINRVAQSSRLQVTLPHAVDPDLLRFLQ